MVNKNYNRGRAFEYRVKKHLEGKGYFVVRSAGSKGAFDLVAITTGADEDWEEYEVWVILIQCKYGTMPSKKERMKLAEYQQTFNWASILIAYAKPREKIKFISPITLKEVDWINKLVK